MPDLHVSSSGSDDDEGTSAAPFATIGRAAAQAMPGDTVIVHAGVYRERVDPPRGGTSDACRITYRAADGDIVVITGSEVVSGWQPEPDGTWTVTLENDFFGDFNPFAERITGDWLDPLSRTATCGMVYLDDVWMTEAPSAEHLRNALDSDRMFLAETGPTVTRVTARFGGSDPNEHVTEVNVREVVFYPSTHHVDFLTVRGFVLQNAAPNWSPPTVEQKAVIGANWSRGWIIEDNVIRHSSCAGLSLGKYGDDWGNGSPGYDDWNLTIERAQAFGWDRDTVGSHVVRRNEIVDCDQVGIVGAFGAAFSVIEHNQVHRIAIRSRYKGAEIAGIKFHNAIDTVIRGNWVHHTSRGMHLDWGTEGTQILGNLFHDNDSRATGDVGFFASNSGQDIFLEVNHGPCLVANNVLLSDESIFNAAHGSAFAHNLVRVVTPVVERWIPRVTPFFEPHGTRTAGSDANLPGDDRFVNNIIVGASGRDDGAGPDAGAFGRESIFAADTPNADVRRYRDAPAHPVVADGNVYLGAIGPLPGETNATRHVVDEVNPQVTVRDGAAWLRFESEPLLEPPVPRHPVTTASLGRVAHGDREFVNPDGTRLRIETDYFGSPRSEHAPEPGPFAGPVTGEVRLWPRDASRSAR